MFIDLLMKWRGIEVSSMLVEMNLESYLETKEIDEVFVCGEDYNWSSTVLDYR